MKKQWKSSYPYAFSDRSDLTRITAPAPTDVGMCVNRNRNPCGVLMVKGLISSNCSGSMIVLYRGQPEVHQCPNISKVFYFPVSVTIGSCSTLLLDHGTCATDEDTPCQAPKISLFLLVTSVALFLTVLVLSFMTLVHCYLRREEIMWRDVSFGATEVEVFKSSKSQKFKYCAFLLVLVTCPKPTSAVCVEPYSSHLSGDQITFNYRLRVNQSACFQHGQLNHLENQELYGLDHLYSTSSWNKYVWSVNGCGNGEYCGSKSDCGKFGSVGMILNKKGNVYKKICKTYLINFFSCFSDWACWVATQEVHYAGKEKYEVYSIGESENEDKFEKRGIEDCEIQSSSQRPTILMGKFLVVSSNGLASWLCPTASDQAFPNPGKLGDLQFSHNAVEFNFEAFRCEFDTTLSSGNCEVAKPFIEEIDEWCVRLPMLAEGGALKYDRGELRMENAGYDDFVLQFKSGTTPVVSQHNCYGRSVKLVGMKDDRGLYMYIFSALSTDNSTWVVHSDCSSEPLEISCDGRETAFHISHSDDHICSFDGVKPTDDRKESGKTEWIWDEADHSAMIAEYHISKWITIVSVLVLVIWVLKCLCR